MDHAEVREILEDAAIEPSGLERLMAGDTPTASLVASHLAGCPDCADELERLRRSVGAIRPVVRTTPPPELRERTLAYVAALGRPRGGDATAERRPATAEDQDASAAPLAAPVPLRRPSRLGPLLGLAAALALAIAGTAVVVSTSRDGELRSRATQIEDLSEVARWTLKVDGQPDARRVALAAAPGGAAGPTGTLLFSPATRDLVVVAEGLVRPPAGREYRCWVEVDGARRPIGRMFFAGNLAYWVGPAELVGSLGPGATFGVTLLDPATPSVPGQDVLVGEG